VAFASPLIGEAHADTSSGASEVYAAGNATLDFMHLSYVMDEANIPFPIPFSLHMDNTTAEAFCNDTVVRSKLKHIDTRQEWVCTLRDRSIVIPKHVDTNDNPSDMYTKILSKDIFVRHRDRILIPVPKN
jgi:hypothetical protein